MYKKHDVNAEMATNSKFEVNPSILKAREYVIIPNQ